LVGCRLFILALDSRRLLVTVLAVFALSFGAIEQPLAQHGVTHQEPAAGSGSSHEHQGHSTVATEGWEGSVAGIAYSERNHHIAGWLVILMGLAELSHALRLSSLGWARLLLPAAMTCTGFFVMVWSDHEAWPVGTLSFSETFFGHDAEIVQHKTYGILALLIGAVELGRRLGRMGHVAWATPLPLMAIIGGLMLFGHSHGNHPSAHKIAMHHAVMGTMAISAGSSKLWSGFAARATAGLSKWELLWAGLILLIGVQLLLYSE